MVNIVKSKPSVFNNGEALLPVPFGFEVAHVSVIDDDGQEFVKVVLADRPVPSPNVLAQVVVER